MSSKICKKCQKVLPLNLFVSNSKRRELPIEYKNCVNCRKRYAEQTAERRRMETPEQRAVRVKGIRDRNFKLRMDAIDAYGGPKCVCCNETMLEFLCIDHVKGGGSKHRKQIGGSGTTIFQWLKSNNYPPEFRVLCMNCNHALGLYGYCPHQEGS